MAKVKKDKQIHVRLTPELKQKVEWYADTKQLPINQVMIDALNFYLIENKGV